MPKLTFPQRKALGGLVDSSTGLRTAKQLNVRSDVLWRLSERGYVSQNIHGQWSIRSAGVEAYREAMRRLEGETT